MKKFDLFCNSCNNTIPSMADWFQSGQKCGTCSSKNVQIRYSQTFETLKTSFYKNSQDGIWRYFDFLPLQHEENIISFGEGNAALDPWRFLEAFALKKYGITCSVLAHRQDQNPATGTFKDLAGSVVASVLKENKILEFVVASTGNTGVSYSYYLAQAGINLTFFIPENAPMAHEEEARRLGQKVIRVKGDYALAKKVAADYAEENNFLLGEGNLDPMRIEAKKTMAYDWLRLLSKMPTVYIQALAGGTGPLAIHKACQEFPKETCFELPRMLMVQASGCSPMADAWRSAKEKNFPEGWQNSFPVYQEPETLIQTLASGNPKTFPYVSQVVYESEGEILAFPEEEVSLIQELIGSVKGIKIGPAAGIAIGGFLESLEKGFIRNGDCVVVNIGESANRVSGMIPENFPNIYETSRFQEFYQNFIALNLPAEK